MSKYHHYTVVPIDVATHLGRTKLNYLLNELDRTNRIFTIDFIKVNGEPSNKNAISVNHKKITGNGTIPTSRLSKRQRGMYIFYSIQETNEQKKTQRLLQLDEKKLYWKTCFISNIKYIKFKGKKYVILNGRIVKK